MRGGFDLEEAEFSDEQENRGEMPSKELLEMYNSDYSLMLDETKHFFAQCKEAISRFVSYSSYGFALNMPFLLNKILCMENNIVDSHGKQLEQQKGKKCKYEENFYSLINKMGELIGDMLNLEIQVKNTYLGQHISNSQKKRIKKKKSIFHKKGNVSGTTSEVSDSIKRSIIEEQLRELSKEENILRGILQQNMVPIFDTPEKVCSINQSKESNLNKLSTKIDSLRNKIAQSKKKQMKIWNIFNEKRPSRSPQDIQTPQPEDKDFQKINNVLSEIASIRNSRLSYLKSDESVETSLY